MRKAGTKMSILFLLPGLGYGLFLGLSQGIWHLMFLSVATAIVWIFARSRKPVDPKGEIEVSISGVAVDGKPLSQFSYFWNPQIQLRVLSVLDAANPNTMLEKLLNTELPLAAGIASNGEITCIPEAHCLIIGPTGAGKTELMRLALERYPGQLAVVDFKGGLGFGGVWGCVAQMTNLDAEPEFFWSWLAQELDERERILILGKIPEKLIVLVDELGQVVASSAQASLLVERICSKGRSLRVFLMAANQTLSGVSRVVLANCGARISLVGIDPVDAMQLGSAKADAIRVSAGWAGGTLIHDSKQLQFSFPLGVSQLSRIEKLKRMGLSNSGVENFPGVGI